MVETTIFVDPEDGGGQAGERLPSPPGFTRTPAREQLGSAKPLPDRLMMITDAARIVEFAIDKQAQTILMPVAERPQLNDLPDDLWTRINIEFYKDSADDMFKVLVE